MAITNIQQLEKALRHATEFQVIKQRNQNNNSSHWSWTFQNNSVPPAGASPASTTAVVLSSASTGAIPFVNAAAGKKAYLGEWNGAINGDLNGCYELHDYLAHMNGLFHNITTLQTVVGFDLDTLGSTSNLAERYGAADYSDVTWWIVVYTQGGDLAVDSTINVTYNDGTTGDLDPYPITFRPRAGSMRPINSYIPAAKSGFYIRGINSITLLAAQPAAGNFGFTATRHIATGRGIKQLTQYKWKWPQLGLEQIYDDSCLAVIGIGDTNNTMFARLPGKAVYG